MDALVTGEGSEFVAGGVGDDAKQPGSEGTRRVVLVECPIGADEALLGRVGGPIGAGHGRCGTHRGALMPAHEFVERVSVTVSGPGGEFGVVQGDLLCRS